MAALVLTGCEDYFAASWGLNTSGQLGNDSVTDSSIPVGVTTTGALAGKTITGISAGNSHSCALTSAATVACWGSNTYGELGARVGAQSQVPVAMDMTGALAGKALSGVSAGNGWTCVLTTDGMVACRGRMGNGQISGPVAGGVVTQVSVGDSHACAVTTLGTVACWGLNTRGQLGDGTFTNSLAPVVVDTSGVLAGKAVTRVSAGDFHTCVVTQDGTPACWGSGTQGELGNDATSDSPVPVEVDRTGALSGAGVRSISAGHQFTCAATTEGTASCWGSNSRGQLGNPAGGETSATPMPVDSTTALSGQDVTSVTAGHSHACASGAAGGAACWGLADKGQLGDGADLSTIPPGSIEPVPVPVVDSLASSVETLDAGAFHTASTHHRSGPTQFVPITSQRVLDTRLSTVERPAAALDPGQRLTVDLADVVPPGATAIAFNLTATGQRAPGYAVVTPGGQASRSSTLNWTAPQRTIANGYIAKLSTTRQLDISMDSAGASHFVLDINGYFAPPGVAGGALFNAVNSRVYEYGYGDPPLAPGESRVISLAGAGAGTDGVAPSAAAVNITVTGTTGPGVLTVAKERTQATSTVNWSGANQTVANAVITEVTTEGTFTVTNNGTTPARMVIDLTGVFDPAAEGGKGAQFYPLDPARIYDSRISGAPLNGGQIRINTYPIPPDAAAVAVNATATGTLGSGYLTINPLTAVVPLSSSLNWYRSPTTVANGQISATSGNATLAYVGGRYQAHYVLDLGGYFR